MTRFAFVIAIALVVGCDDGTPTASTCPTSNAPTYGSFGEVFFTTYCTGCHSASAADRDGAPDDFNFDTEAEIKQHAADIDTEAASGPKATNTAMPELDSAVPQAPSTDERALLGQFLACEQQSN
jgi:uncharacterized membrane protein